MMRERDDEWIRELSYPDERTPCTKCAHRFDEHRAGRHIVCWVDGCGCTNYQGGLTV